MLIIKEIRKEKKLSQTRLSELAGVSLRTVQNYEAGNTQGSYEKMKSIADALGCTIEELNSSNHVPQKSKLSNNYKTNTNEKTAKDSVENVRHLKDTSIQEEFKNINPDKNKYTQILKDKIENLEKELERKNKIIDILLEKGGSSH